MFINHQFILILCTYWNRLQLNMIRTGDVLLLIFILKLKLQYCRYDNRIIILYSCILFCKSTSIFWFLFENDRTLHGFHSSLLIGHLLTLTIGYLSFRYWHRRLFGNTPLKKFAENVPNHFSYTAFVCIVVIRIYYNMANTIISG